MPLPLLLAVATAATLLAAGASGAEIPATMDPAAIPNYRVIRDGVAAAGQPSAETLARLRALGFRTVVSLRAPAEGPADEEAIVTGQGLRYVSVPVTPATFSLADVRAVKAVLDDPKAGPVLVHCSSANRVGALWAVLRVEEGASLADAEAEGIQAGLASESMRQAVRHALEQAAPARR